MLSRCQFFSIWYLDLVYPQSKSHQIILCVLTNLSQVYRERPKALRASIILNEGKRTKLEDWH